MGGREAAEQSGVRREAAPDAPAWGAARLPHGPGKELEERSKGRPGRLSFGRRRGGEEGGSREPRGRGRGAQEAPADRRGFSLERGAVRERDARFLEKSRGRRIIAGCNFSFCCSGGEG